MRIALGMLAKLYRGEKLDAVSEQTTWYNDCMPSFRVETPQRRYPIMVERGGLSKLRDYIPARAGKIFFVSTEDVWQLHGATLTAARWGSRARSDLLSGRRIAQAPGGSGSAGGTNGAERRGPLQHGGGGGRRHRHRCRGIPGGYLHARHSFDPDPHHAARRKWTRPSAEKPA